MRTLLAKFALALPALAGFLACASLPASAEAPLDELLRGLRSEDPGARVAARESLLHRAPDVLPAISAFAARERDVEAAAAAREIGEEIELASIRAKLVAFAAALEDEGARANLESAGPGSLMVLCDLLRWEPRLTAEGAFAECDDRGDFRGSAEDGPESRVARLACNTLSALTLAGFGENRPEWEGFARAHRGDTWREIRLCGLESQGFQVRNADPNVAAAELIRVAHKGARAFVAGRDNGLTIVGPVLDETFDGLIDTPAAFSALRNSAGPRVASYHWLRLNADCFEWLDGKLHSTAGPYQYRALLASGDPNIRRSALCALAPSPDEIPKEGWRILGDDLPLALRVMATTAHPVPRALLGRVLEAIPDPLLRPDLVSFWDWNDVEAYADDPGQPPEIHDRALRALLLHGDPNSPALLLHEPGPGLSDRQADDGDPACEREAFHDACLGDEAQLERAARWFSNVWPTPGWFEVGSVLARRGRIEGLDAALGRADAGIGFDDRFHPLFRAIVEDAPAGDDDDAWRAWGKGGDGRFRWNPGARRWELKR